MQVALRFSSLAYSPSGALLVGGSEYGALYIWDAFSGEVLFGPLPSHTCDMGDLVTHLCFVTDDIVLSSCFDGSIHQWNIRAGEPIGEAFTAHSRSVLKVASLPDKKMAASITVDGELILWRLDTLEVVRQSRVMVDVAVFAFSSDGTKMATLYHHMLHTYDVENCRLISEVDLKPYIPPMSLVLAFSLNASKVFFGSGSDSLAVWDVDKEEIKEEILILDYRNPVEIICSPDGALVASLSNGRQNKIHIWSTATRELVDVLDDGGPFPAFAFTPDSKNLTYVLRDTELSVNPLKNIKKLEKPRSSDSWKVDNSASHFRHRESRRLSWFLKRNKRLQVEERKARNKNPPVVSPYEGSRRTRHQQNKYDSLRPGPSSTIDEERKPDVDEKHGLGCFAVLRLWFRS